MKVVLYVNDKNALTINCLQKIIRTCIPSDCLEVFGSSRDFALRLYQIPRNIDVAVLYALNNDQLFELITLKDFLMDIRIILILPDREYLTVKRGHTLFPKFTSYIDSCATDVVSVLNKMCSSQITNKNAGGCRRKNRDRVQQARHDIYGSLRKCRTEFSVYQADTNAV
jgi:hypothetical protein